MKTIPSQKKKERIFLEEIAKSFEKGKVYSENEINQLICNYFEDYCTIRRVMIEEGILNREKAQYVRIM